MKRLVIIALLLHVCICHRLLARVANARRTSLRMVKDDDFMKIIEYMNQGKIEKLKDMGIKINKKDSTLKDELDDKLGDDDVRNAVLGTLTTEEEEVIRLMELQQNQLNAIEETSDNGMLEPELLNDILGDANSLLQEKSRIGSFLSSASTADDGSFNSLYVYENNNVDILRQVDEQKLADSPPAGYGVFEVEELEEDIENHGDDHDDSGVTSTGSNEKVFAELLKATMEASEEAAAASPDEVVQQTLNAVNMGDLSQLDLQSVLGDALKSLTDQLDIDISKELDNPATKRDLQAILATSMSELATNMKELDEKSKELYGQLDTVRQDLLNATATFDEQKTEELDKILFEQAKLQQELALSAAAVKEKTDNLSNILSDYESTGDAVTQLALFPLKKTTQKIAFIVGLALAFKVPYDVVKAATYHDYSDGFSVAVQFLLSITLFHYYGLIQAFFRGKNTE